MADFLEQEAEEATDDDEELTDDESGSQSKREKPKKKKPVRIDDDDEDEEEDELDEAARAELANFIQDEIEEVDDDMGAPADEGKRKHSDDELDMEDLEEDDYDLIEENLGLKINRKKRRRVRAVADDSDEETEANDRDAIANQLFDGTEDAEPESAPQKRKEDRGPRNTVADEEINDDEEDYSDTDSFIVDDDGVPIHGPRKKGGRRYADTALQEAQDIFGLDFNVADFDDDQDADEYDEDGEYEEDEEEVSRRPRRRKTKKSVMDVYEPSDLEHSLRTHFDNQVRLADVPERFQLRSIPVESPPEDRAATELQEEARWIYYQLFVEPSLSDQKATKEILFALAGKGPFPSEQRWESRQAYNRDYEEDAEVKLNEVKINKVKDILDFIRNHFLEDRFIATYRKEYWDKPKEDKQEKENDQKPVEPENPDNFLDSEELREIYERDLNWMQLQRRRTNLLKLMTKMRDYLRSYRVVKTEDSEGGPEVTDETLDIIRNAASLIELQDLFSEFRQTYSEFLPHVLKTDVKKNAVAVSAMPALDADGNPTEGKPDIDGKPDIEAEALTETMLEEQTPTSPGVKRARRTDPYIICKEAGLEKLVQKFGLTAEQFAKNCDVNWLVTVPEQEEHDPEVVAERFISPRFPTVNDVLLGGVFMMASSIARNAHFRRVARKRFYRMAVLQVEATSRGIKEIDENHPCYGMKWLSKKPVKDLVDDQYLKLMQAKQEGQLEVNIQILDDQEGVDQLLHELKPMFSVDEFRKETQAWNVLRAKAVEKALKTFLYPALAKEVHEKLLAEAKGFVKTCIRRTIYNWLNVAPYYDYCESLGPSNFGDGAWDLSDGIRVMGIAYENNWDQPAYAVVTDGYGDVLESVKLPTLTNTRGLGRMRVNPEDVEKVMDLFRERKPHVIAICGESRKALDIRDQLNLGLSQLQLNHKGAPFNVPVEIIDNRLSLLYQNSETGRLEFPNYHPLQRQAVSIARRLIDPLLAFSQLFNMDDDLLSLNFHPLQGQLSKEEFRNALQIEFVRRVNEVGVDLNECVSHPLTHGNVVQFVCGLGPRKAQHLLKVVKQNGVIVSRNQLVMICRLGPRVFINCAGFIRINVNELHDSVTGETYIEPLDASRVHPETYDWARKMAVDALDYDESADGANPSEALQSILQDPTKLTELDLNAFTVELERQNFGNKKITLDDISAELFDRFKERRLPYVSPTEAELFRMVIGEDPSEYREGRMFTVKVNGFMYKRCNFPPRKDNSQGQLERREVLPTPVKVAGANDYYCPRCRQRGYIFPQDVFHHMEKGQPECQGELDKVKVFLDNGIFGTITLDNLSDRRVEIPQERVKVGMVIHARLITLDAPKFWAEFTSRSSLLKDEEGRYKPSKDKFYDEAGEKQAVEKELKKRNKRAPKMNYLKRVIAHPSFKNFDYHETERYLRTLPPGDAVIRPSSKGNNKLTISWKIAEGIHDHVEVVEQDKENVFSLGQKLVINDEPFDDLDEILARYILPMSMLVNELLNHKYYVDSHGGLPATLPAQRAVIENWLREEKSRAPGRIPFCFSACVAFPRKFFLSHLPRQNIHEEFLTVTPAGYIYRRNTFPNMNRLLAYFKGHFHEPPPTATPSNMGSVLITPSSHLGSAMNVAALTNVVQNMPAAVWEHLKGASGAAGISGTPMFTPGRTPSSNSAMGQPQNTPSALTPGGASSVSAPAGPWGHAAKLWQKAMTGEPSMPSPFTPQSVGTPHSVNTPVAVPTNWSAAAEAWVSSANSNKNPPATPVQDPGATPSAATAAAAWIVRNKAQAGGSTPRQ